MEYVMKLRASAGENLLRTNLDQNHLLNGFRMESHGLILRVLLPF